MTESHQPAPDIQSDSEYRETSIALHQQRHPPRVLRRLMNAFESYRQARKYGWSRPWNKVDLLNFLSFRLHMREDVWLLDTARRVLAENASRMPDEARAFVDELLADSDLMGFFFVHDFTEGERQHEGATLSLGRVNQKRYRDRIDIIVESELVEGRSQGLSRCRIFIDPFRDQERQLLWRADFTPAADSACQPLFAALSHLSHAWQYDTDRLWDHWTSAYIDYFGDRALHPQASFFPAQSGCERLERALPEGAESLLSRPLAGAA